MRIIKSIILISTFCVFFSCTSTKKNELDKVIEHYSDPADSLKLKAAKFLIENLKGQPILDTNTVAPNQVYFDLIYNTWKHEKMRVGFRLPIQTRVLDSLIKTDDLSQNFLNISYVDDAELVTSDFLIKNIENAFYVWRNMPWAKNISFNDFCEYILPYRSSNTYSLDARNYFMNKYNGVQDSVNKTTNPFIAGKFINDDISKWFAEDLRLMNRYPFLQPIKFSNLIKGKFGDCQDAQSLRIAALRAIGVPAVMDEIPGWGNSDLQHYWYRIIDPAHDTVKTKITNMNIPGSTQHLITTSSFDDPDYGEYPKNIEVKYGRSVPKVYRRCFAKQQGSLAEIKGSTDEVPTYFRNPWIKDVSTEYLESADLSVSLNGKVASQKYVYLCTFDNQNWKPVAWALNNNQVALFKNMGKNIVYLPAYYKNGKVIPASDPFLLNDNGKTQTINAGKKTEIVKLYAKFPTRTYVLANEHSMVGGRFQLANKEDLSDSVTVHTVKSTPFERKDIKVINDKKFRFLIFQFNGIPVTQMSEITFYGLDNFGKEVQLHGKIIGNKGANPYLANRLFDGNRANYFKSAMDDPFTYVGIDLGENKASKITRISYVPHSDDNNVVFNDHYQLYYWNEQWLPIGESTGVKDNTVTFKNVPKNALLLVKNLAGGIEERIFRYKNGKQEFW